MLAALLASATAHAETPGDEPKTGSGDRPLLISSWHGNNFGVAAELRGTYRLEAQRLTIVASSLRLRQVKSCQYGCVTIKQVRIGVYGESGPGNFSTYANSEPLLVNRTFDKSSVLDLGAQTFVLNLNAQTPLPKTWLGIDIDDEKGGSYYAHTARNFFAQEFAAMGWAPDACASVKGEAQAIKSGCNVALRHELEYWARPLTSLWGRLRGRAEPVWIALHENNVEAVRILHAHGENIDPIGQGGETPLMLAAANGATDMVGALLQNGANPKHAVASGNQKGRTALNGAISANSAATVDVLLKHGARYDIPDGFGWLPVHYAVYYGSVDALRALGDRGADLNTNAPGQRGETPLMVAAQYSKLPALQFLLERGVDISRLDRHEKNALDYAEFFKQADAASLLRNAPAVSPRRAE